MKIIFAQGNPDKKYERTRHNTGFFVLDALASQHSAPWKENSKYTAAIAEIEINDEKVLLVKPSSYYNETGAVARRLIDFYKLDPKNDLLVVHDDLALPFGTLRVRTQGSDAGNNGVKSLNQHLGQSYTRLRVGIWAEQREHIDDADFVLSAFTRNEQEKLKNDIIPHSMTAIEQFVNGDLEPTSHQP